MDFNFDRYNGDFQKHLARHLPGSKIAGSVFTHPRFRTTRQIIDYAYEQIKEDYVGRRLVREIEYHENVGLEGIILVREVPRHFKIKRGTRVKKAKDSKRSPSYTALIVEGLARPKTNRMVIIAEPVDGIHRFSSIYPGRYAPEFDDAKFWRENALIV